MLGQIMACCLMAPSHYLTQFWFSSMLQLQCSRNNELTLNMLNCLKDLKRCIHILYHILDFVQRKKNKFTKEQPYMLPILFCQYHSCWCPGDFKSQVINRHGIDQLSQKILSLASKELITEFSHSSWNFLYHFFQLIETESRIYTSIN